MQKYFNTAGVCLPDWHYMLPPVPRLPEARPLIDRGQYFVVHAPRQTGKTTTLVTLARALTAEGRYAAVYITCETGRAMGDDYVAVQRLILAEFRARAQSELPAELRPPPWPHEEDEEGRLLGAGLEAWARACPRPLVLFFDEIDGLSGASLYSVLSQLRGGSEQRPAGFPHSVVLCGLRDVRDWNIKAKSLRLGNFTRAEVEELYGQHTAETGQPFTEQAVARAFDYTQGQPWLVNALAALAVDELNVEPPTPITPEHLELAKERLIQARQTHLNSLVDKLSEERVRRVIEPLIAGEAPEADPTYNDDVSYLRDLGLIAQNRPVR